MDNKGSSGGYMAHQVSNQPSSPSNVGSEQPMRQIFTPEELRTLRECSNEAFYYRCMPLAAILSSGVFIAIRRGILSASPRFGYVPKILGASLVGYFGGKLSYQSACAEKIMRLPNSPLGEALRKKKGVVGFQETLAMEPGFSLGFDSSTAAERQSEQPIFDDHRPDVRDHVEGLDDYHKVTDSLSPYTEQPSDTAPQQFTSYAELRQMNREEYVNKMAERYRRLPQDSAQNPGAVQQSVSTQEQPSSINNPYSQPVSSTPAPKKNKYGDIWEE
ncbi:OCIA domain-containing protein asrij [Oratosquilla oratoria]|uniref:OCIA domain-containing protein asrij n=1 Tax=Oratosquilla oratoria TaxID=337810 RepID=UPI003F760ADC